MGVPIVTEYRPGASAVVGSDALAKSPPDGYTIMMGYTAHSTNPLFNASMPYDTLRDFTPVIYVCYVPAVLMVHPSTPANTVQGAGGHDEEDARQLHLRLGRRGRDRAPLRRAAQASHRRRPAARSLQGQRAGAQRPARRPRHHDVRHRLDRAAAGEGGQAEGTCGDEREALARCARPCRP